MTTPLSKRESQVLVLIAYGLTNRDVAKALGITVSTTRSHLHTIYAKLRVTNRTQAVMAAFGTGLLSMPTKAAAS